MVIPQPRAALHRVSILATDGVFASTLMQAKDFFHMAGIRHARQQGLGHEPPFEIHLVSPDGLPVNSFSKVQVPVDGGLDACDVIILPAFAARFPKVLLNQDKHLSDADNLYCASGVTSACDLYIYLIERYCGTGVAQGVARDILYEVQRSYTPGRIGFGGQKLHQDVTVLQIQHWLEEHYADKFRFEDVAREHGMSIRNFMRRFQGATGDKPLHYLQRLRIETAKSLLSATRKSIKTISYEVGYDDASFFARLFRQHTELSPNQYRRQFQQKDKQD